MPRKYSYFAIIVTVLHLFVNFANAQSTAIRVGKVGLNIIFILTDNDRWDVTGYARNKLAYTPEMDKLAHSGPDFNNAIATTPICSASKASSGSIYAIYALHFSLKNQSTARSVRLL